MSRTELEPTEPHPSAASALAWLRSQDPTQFAVWSEAFSSCAIEGNRLGEICGETLRRLMAGETVGDRYLLGLCWYLRESSDRNVGSGL